MAFSPLRGRLGSSFAGHLAAQVSIERSQMLKHLLRRFLLSVLLGGTFRPANKLGLTVIAHRLQSYLDRKRLAVLRTQLFHQYIRRLRTTTGLKSLLQRRLIIGKR